MKARFVILRHKNATPQVEPCWNSEFRRQKIGLLHEQKDVRANPTALVDWRTSSYIEISTSTKRFDANDKTGAGGGSLSYPDPGS